MAPEIASSLWEILHFVQDDAFGQVLTVDGGMVM